ncbi:MAG TPA: histidine kinase [Candidatus Cybelea sp.]|nr:histidine kinase [Candidatus Cybelea sp.]
MSADPNTSPGAGIGSLRSKNALTRYGLALLATLLALGLQGLIGRLVGNHAYLTVWAAVAFSALYCGLGPSLVSLLTGALGVWFFFLAPPSSQLKNPGDIFNTILFILLCDFIVIMAEANRRAQGVRARQARVLDTANARLARELADVSRLHELSTRLLSETELVPLLNEVLAACADLLGTDRGIIRLYDERAAALRVVTQLGFPEEFLKDFESIPAADPVFETIRQNRKRILVEDARTDPRFRELAPVAEKYGFAAAQFTPLIGSNGNFLGVLSNHFLMPHCPAEHELRLLDLCVGHAVRAIERTRLEQELRAAHDVLEQKVEQRTSALQIEIAERKHAELLLRDSEQSLRELSAHLLRTQDIERRRIGRELHDSVGQLLALLKMELHSLKSRVGSGAAGQKLAECCDLAEESIKQVRTVSYLLHPPLLEELGLKSAIPWYLEGFSKRSGINTTVEISPALGRLSSEVELAIFRVLQESLTNVHRHSGSSTAHVRVWVNKDLVSMEIEDHGKGIESNDDPPLPRPPGVGLQGMSERMRNIGGKLEVHFGGQGTIIRATAPCAQPAAASAKAGSG